MTQTTQVESVGFRTLGIVPQILEILDKVKFDTPTPIQAAAIPAAIAGQDILGIAQTGTGKTLAFGIPMIQYLAQKPGTGLVIVPTRELALQVEEELYKFSRKANLRTAVIIGGAAMGPQKQALRGEPAIIVGTPGRLMDHLQQGSLRLDDVAILVLDEADRMLDMGFAPQISQIVKSVPKERQTMLFSATMPDSISKLAHSYLKNPKRIEVAQAGTPAAHINQSVLMVPGDSKRSALQQLLSDHAGTVLVFSRTKHGARKICASVQGMGHHAAEIHSNKSLAQRREALDGFKSGRYRVLIATDIASRGIDVNNIELVVNYDLPDNLEDYVHRIGRTGRAGKAGKAISLVTPAERGDVRRIEKLIRQPLPLAPMGNFVPVRDVKLATDTFVRDGEGDERQDFDQPRGGRSFHKPFRSSGGGNGGGAGRPKKAWGARTAGHSFR